MGGRFIALLLAYVFIGAQATPSFAAQDAAVETAPQGQTDSCAVQQAHVLGGHLFLPMSLLPQPFVETHASLLVAGGFGNYPALGFGNPAVIDRLELGAMEFLVNIQYAVTSWLAASVGASVNGVTGINTSSAVIYGASVARQWNLELLGQILRTDRASLSLGLVVQLPHSLSISPLEVIPNFNRSVAFSAPDFTNSNVDVAWRPTLRLAYAFNRTIGLNAILGATALQLSNPSPDQNTVKGNFGLGVNADLKPKLNVPLGLTAAYYRNQIVQDDDVNANIWSFGLWETVWTQAAIGLELGFGDVVGQSSTIGAVSTRVYF